jgi:hypothetical protein
MLLVQLQPELGTADTGQWAMLNWTWSNHAADGRIKQQMGFQQNIGNLGCVVTMVRRRETG